MSDLNTESKDITNKEASEGLIKLVTEIRSELENKNKTASEVQTKIDKMETDLFAFEGKNQELLGKMAAQKKVVDALEQFASKQSNIIPNENGEQILNPEMVDAYYKYLTCRDSRILLTHDESVRKFYHQNDVDILLPKKDRESKSYVPFSKIAEPSTEKKYMRTDVGDAGGFLVPPEFIPTILRRLTEISPVRQYASTRTTYSNIAQIPVRNVLVTGGWGYEGQGSIPQSQSQYTRPEVHMKRMHVTVPITIEELMDSPFDIQAEVSNDVNEEFARLEGQAFIVGDSNLQVEGLMTNADISITKTGKVAEITGDSVIEMFGAIKYQSYGNQMYDRTYGFNRRTWIKILQLKDGQGRYIWSLGNIAAGIPNSILGASYFIAPDMDDVAANTYPIVMGDFKKGYMIVDRMMMYMVRDEVTTPGYIKLTFIRRLGAKVLLAEAFNKLKVAV